MITRGFASFASFANLVGQWVAHPLAFVLAAASVVAWAVTGPIFGWSDTWQLVVNTGTTVLTFLIVFLLQNTQNRNAAALHVKLDELLRAMPESRTGLALRHLEDADDATIEAERARLEMLARRVTEQ